MFNGKKGQFFILSTMFFVLLLLFTYSIETENSYIVKSSKNHILNNIIHETCQVGINSNGSYIDQRYVEYAGNVSLYCDSFGYTCTLNIVNNTVIPPSGNSSLLNYTHYDYSIDFEAKNYSYSGGFSC